MNSLSRNYTATHAMLLRMPSVEQAPICGHTMAEVLWRETRHLLADYRKIHRRRLLNLGEAAGLDRQALRALMIEPRPEARARMRAMKSRPFTNGEIAEILVREYSAPRKQIPPFIIDALAGSSLDAEHIRRLVHRAFAAQYAKAEPRKRYIALATGQSEPSIPPRAKAFMPLMRRIAAENGITVHMMLAQGLERSNVKRLARARWVAILALYSMETANFLSPPPGSKEIKHGFSWISRILGLDHTTVMHAVQRMGLDRCCGCDRNRHGHGDFSRPPLSLRAEFDQLNRKA